MWIVLILTVIVVSVFCFAVVQYFEIKKKMAANDLEKEAVLQKYAPIMDVEAERADIQRQLDELKQNFEKSTASLKLNYKEKKAIYDSLQSKIRLLQDDEEMFEVGIYHPQFDIEDGEKFKQAIKANREKQKDSVRNKEACTCSTEWEVGGSKREGKKMTDQKIRLMLRAFNGECDAAISKVNWRNASTMEARIEKAYESINKQGESSSTMLARGVRWSNATGRAATRGGRITNICFNPVIAFLKQLLLKRAFLDGWRGWAAAGAVAVGTLCKHIAIMERRGLEKERAKGGVEPEDS